MAKSAVRYKKRENLVYNNKLTNNSSQNPTYFEFDQKDQVYSYATETSWHNISSDGSNRTVSTYTEGRVRTQGRSGDTDDLYLRNRNYPDSVSPSALGDSITSTGTTYDQIADTNFTNIPVDVSADTTNVQRDKKTAFSLGRIIVILTVLIALSIGAVLIYMFVINKNNSKGPDCNSIPEVIKGEIDNSKSNQESVTVTVLCKKGYQMEGNETLACEKGVWTAQPKCVPIKCGEFPNVENGTVNGTGFEFNSTAEVVCDPGFSPDGSDTITCQADGNWSSTPDCVQHPCGVFTPAVDLLPVRESNSSYLTLCFKCKPGLTFTNGSDHCVTCHQGEWEGHTECEVSGVINFQSHQLSYSANNMVTLACAVRDSPNWHSVGLSRTDNDGSVVEPLYNILNTDGEIEVKQLSSISTYNVEYDLVTNGVNLVFKIDNIKCEDSGIYICANIVGDIESPDKVKSTNTSVTVKAQTVAPEWEQVPDDIISGTSTLFKCSGEIGDPKGYIDVESNLDGNYSLLLTTKLTQDSNEVGFIIQFTDEKTKCGYRRTVAFQLRNTTSRYHQKGLRCVSRPSDSLANGQTTVSDTRLIEVIPDDYCGITDTILPHPYHCDRFVICGIGKVAGVPAGCGDNCFNIDVNTCYPCEELGGCSITDIYIDGYNGWIQEGHSTSMICKVRDFEGLTDIVITKDDNSTVISKVFEEDIDGATGVTYVSEHSYINGTFGQLTIRFDSVKCQHKGTYQCFPVGSGKSSNDETTLALRDSNGNLIC